MLDPRSAVAATVMARTARIETSVRRLELLSGDLEERYTGVADLAARRADLLSDPPGLRYIYDWNRRYLADGHGPWRRMGRIGRSPLGFLDMRVRWLPGARALGEAEHHGDPVERFWVAATRPSVLQPFVVELWVDEAGRLRLVGLRRANRRPRLPRRWERVLGSKERPLWQTTELYDFGVTADIRIPRRDETQPILTWRDLPGL